MSLRYSIAAACLMATTVSFAPVNTASASPSHKIMLVFDSSGSMRKAAGPVSRMDAAKQAMSQVLGGVSADTEIGLVAYGHRKGKDCSDIEVIAEPRQGGAPAIAAAVRAMKPLGETPIADAVRMAAQVAQYDELPATVVLVTDGEESCKGDPCALAGELEREGIDFTAHVIGFGYEGGARAGAACLAEQTGGQYLAAADADQLAAALVQVVSQPAAPSGTVVASDDFDGNGLAEAWEVINPDDTVHLVEDGKLTTATAELGYLIGGKQPNNIFAWNGELPAGDFDIAADLTAEMGQAAKAIAEVAIYDSQKDVVTARLYRDGSSNNQLFLEVVAIVDGKKSNARTRVATGACCPKKFDMEEVYSNVEKQGGRLTLERRGRKVAARLDLKDWQFNDDTPSTLRTDELLVLKPKGRAALYGGTWGANYGRKDSTIVHFDRFEILSFE
jgi:Ca-activated chloride channel homolog